MKIWKAIFVLSIYVILACGIVAYLQVVIDSFFSGRYVLGVFLSALFLAGISCWAGIILNRHEKPETKAQASDNES